VLCGREEKFVRTLMEALERPDLVASALAPAGPDQQPATDFLAATFATRSRDEWVHWFEGRDIAFAPVLDFAEALGQPHVLARGLLVEAAGAHHLAPAIRFAGEPPWAPSEPPGLASATG